MYLDEGILRSLFRRIPAKRRARVLANLSFMQSTPDVHSSFNPAGLASHNFSEKECDAIASGLLMKTFDVLPDGKLPVIKLTDDIKVNGDVIGTGDDDSVPALSNRYVSNRAIKWAMGDEEGCAKLAHAIDAADHFLLALTIMMSSHHIITLARSKGKLSSADDQLVVTSGVHTFTHPFTDLQKYGEEKIPIRVKGKLDYVTLKDIKPNRTYTLFTNAYAKDLCGDEALSEVGIGDDVLSFTGNPLLLLIPVLDAAAVAADIALEAWVVDKVSQGVPKAMDWLVDKMFGKSNVDTAVKANLTSDQQTQLFMTSGQEWTKKLLAGYATSTFEKATPTRNQLFATNLGYILPQALFVYTFGNKECWDRAKGLADRVMKSQDLPTLEQAQKEWISIIKPFCDDAAKAAIAGCEKATAQGVDLAAAKFKVGRGQSISDFLATQKGKNDVNPVVPITPINPVNPQDNNKEEAEDKGPLIGPDTQDPKTKGNKGEVSADNLDILVSPMGITYQINGMSSLKDLFALGSQLNRAFDAGKWSFPHPVDAFQGDDYVGDKKKKKDKGKFWAGVKKIANKIGDPNSLIGKALDLVSRAGIPGISQAATGIKAVAKIAGNIIPNPGEKLNLKLSDIAGAVSAFAKPGSGLGKVLGNLQSGGGLASGIAGVLPQFNANPSYAMEGYSEI